MSRARKKRISDDDAWQQAYDAVDHAPLLTAVGAQISPEMLKLALTHRSFANEHNHLPNNERLEFVGDAVLGLSVAHKLFELYPSRPESELSPMRAAIVSRYGLADIAREIDLGPHMLIGRGEELTGGREKESILADTTEALLGAIYLEHGFETARKVVLTLFDAKLRSATATTKHQDWKTTLQVRLAELKLPVAEYRAEAEGPDHNQIFTAEVLVDGVVRGTGTGPNKKLAEQEAAHQAVLFLRDHTAEAVLGAQQ
ncbi:Ribonuclease 3 [Corynebacterium glaucum]|uniref:Ribonuclease 3 n=1 Tax=Corynebacterium glaucum TaxID=187491 RepID=A0A1Q2HXH9_9CORY|nr:ribonuclease III [Corynebacterium glaucum]AQQ15566.1 Ribonuclease 3 [Corynebacterium glaucum]